MKKFIELIQRVYEENIQSIMRKILSEKIPVAFLYNAPFEESIRITKVFRAQNFNITNLICTDLPNEIPKFEFEITPLDNISKIHPRPEYIFGANIISSRIALKYAPDCKVIDLDESFIFGQDGTFYNAFMNHLTELQEFYESLIDEESRKAFYGYWLGRASCQPRELFHTSSSHYLTAGFIPAPGGVVIEGGVFDGGTATMFSEMGYKVYAFEMNRANFEITKPVAAEKNFVLENLALGSFKHEMRYNPIVDSGGKLNSIGAAVAQVIKLDTYIRENKIPRVDYIKLDVEGAELDILKGAVITIARDKPILAISAYHKAEDFWTLMNFIKSVRPDYEFALRHGTLNAEEEPVNFRNNLEEYFYSLGLEPEVRNFCECVLFAR